MATASKTGGFSGEIVMYLSKDEADTLAAILCRVGGDPELSPRKHQETMRDALKSAGYDYHDSKAHKLLESRGSINFKNYPKPFRPGHYQEKHGQDVRYFAVEPFGGIDNWKPVKVVAE